MPNPLQASPDDFLSDEVILITGAGGSIGSALAKRLAAPPRPISAPPASSESISATPHVRAQHRCAPASQDVIRTLVLLDLSEQNLYEIHAELTGATASRSEPQRVATCVPILGDIRDAALLDDLFQKFRPTKIFHAAAFKHVPLMEQNPIAVIANNILGTSTLAAAALKHRARQLLMISTDKAVQPRSIMGAAKRVAELILQRQSSATTRMSSLRLGNVLGSTGSVVPLFQQQIARGGPVTVTHPDASRYFLPIDEAVNLILSAAALDESSSILVPELGNPIKIIDLAKKMIRDHRASAAPAAKQIEIKFTGLRPGDKLTEHLASSTETLEPTTNPKLRRVRGPHLCADLLDSTINLISEKVQSRDLPALLDGLRILVPDYQLSAALTSIMPPQFAPTKV